MLLPSHLNVTDVEGMIRLCKKNVSFLNTMTLEARAGLHVVTWEQYDLKKVAILSFKFESTLVSSRAYNTFTNEYHVYATGSLAESDHEAIKDMLGNLQRELSVIMPSIYENQPAIVLGDNCSESHKVKQLKREDTTVLSHMKVKVGEVLAAPVELPRVGENGEYTDMCIDGQECKKPLRPLPGHAPRVNAGRLAGRSEPSVRGPHSIDRHI